MTWQAWVLLALLGFWIPVVAVFVAYMYFRTVNTRRSERFELERAEREIYLQRETGGDSYRHFDAALADLTERVERGINFQSFAARDLSSEVAETVSRRLEDSIATLATRLTTSSQATPVLQRDDIGEFRIVSELAHSLKTPLAHIDATVGLLKHDIHDDEVAEMLNELAISVDLCKSTLAAFREVTRVSGRAESWAPRSLAQSITGAHRVYNRQVKKETSLSLTSPEEVAGYSNNYLLALILPLLENAVEAAGTTGSVSIQVLSNGEVLIRVENAIEGPVDGTTVETRGQSTKPDHDGIGVQVVRSLVGAREGASSNYSYDDETFVFQIVLPGRKDGV